MGYNDDIKDYGYDPKAALLKEAGLEKASPSIQGDAGTASPITRMRVAAEMIRADWAKIGVQAKIVTYE